MDALPLSRVLAQRCLRPVDADTRERAAWHVLDWLGCAAAGSATGVAAAMWAGSRPPGGGSDAAADPWQALLFEAALGNVFEMDDIHRAALCHPGPVVVPAARFVARRLGADGPALLEAVARGYEAMIRLGMAAGPAHYVHFHPTATCGAVGAAVAAGALLGLPGEALAHAIGLAATRAAGLWQVRLEPCTAKAWHNAHAAHTGVQAAMLARAGMTAPAHVLEGEKGFLAALCAGGSPEAIDAGGPWLIHATSFKPWPACRHTHPAIDAALCLREQLPGSAGAAAAAVVEVDVQTYADAIEFCDAPEPSDPHAARFSLQHAVAVALLRGEPGFADFAPAALRDEPLSRVRAAVKVRAAARFTRRYPARFGATVSLRLADGCQTQMTVDDARGDPERPLAPAALEAKARDAMRAGRWDDTAITAAIAACRALPGATSLQSLPALRPTA